MNQGGKNEWGRRGGNPDAQQISLGMLDQAKTILIVVIVIIMPDIIFFTCISSFNPHQSNMN